MTERDRPRPVLYNSFTTWPRDCSLGATVEVARSVGYLPGLMRQGTSTHDPTTVAGTGWFITELPSTPTASSIGLRRGAALGTGTASWTVVEFAQ